MTSPSESSHVPAQPSRFSKSVLDIVSTIPSGKVMTYGGVAAALGSAGARAVGGVMARHGSGVVWWRVINASGAPPRGLEEEALTHYWSEGTPLDLRGDEYRVDLTRALHHL